MNVDSNYYTSPSSSLENIHPKVDDEKDFFVSLFNELPVEIIDTIFKEYAQSALNEIHFDVTFQPKKITHLNEKQHRLGYVNFFFTTKNDPILSQFLTEKSLFRLDQLIAVTDILCLTHKNLTDNIQQDLVNRLFDCFTGLSPLEKLKYTFWLMRQKRTELLETVALKIYEFFLKKHTNQELQRLIDKEIKPARMSFIKFSNEQLFTFCCENNYLELAKKLVEDKLIIRSEVSRFLKYACENAYKNFVQWFLEDQNVISQSNPLSAAASRGHLNIVKILCEDARFSKEYEKALKDACKPQNEAVITYLLDALSRTNKSPSYNETLQHIFIHCYQHELFDLANTLVTKYQFTPSTEILYEALYSACQKGQVKSVKRLIRNYHLKIYRGQKSAVTEAAMLGQTEVVKFLLKNKSLNAGDLSLDSALYNACINNHLETVKEILADPRAKPSDQTFLAVLSRGSTHLAVLQALLAHPLLPLDKYSLDLLKIYLNQIEDPSLFSSILTPIQTRYPDFCKS